MNEQHWHRGDRLVRIGHSRRVPGDRMRYLNDPTMTLPLPFLDGGWQGSDHIMQFEGNRTINER